MATNYLTYKNIFVFYFKAGTPIYDTDGKLLKMEPDEKWVQCYDPHDNVRKEYPKYIFVSNKGNFVSARGKELRWLKPSITSNDRDSYKFSVKGHPFSQIGYIVVAVCHGAKRFGKADEILAKEGKDAFKNKSLEVHHDVGYDLSKGRAYNNDPGTLTILTINIHSLFDDVPKEGSSLKEDIEFMQEMQKRVMEETNKPVILIPKEAGKTGTIGVLYDAERIPHFESDDKQWYLVPYGADYRLLQEWNENAEKANLVEESIIKHCESFLEVGNQTIVKATMDNTSLSFIVMRRDVNQGDD